MRAVAEHGTRWWTTPLAIPPLRSPGPGRAGAVAGRRRRSRHGGGPRRLGPLLPLSDGVRWRSCPGWPAPSGPGRWRSSPSTSRIGGSTRSRACPRRGTSSRSSRHDSQPTPGHGRREGTSQAPCSAQSMLIQRPGGCESRTIACDLACTGQSSHTVGFTTSSVVRDDPALWRPHRRP